MNTRSLMNLFPQCSRLNGFKSVNHRILAKTRAFCRLVQLVDFSPGEIKNELHTRKKKSEENLVLNITDEESKSILKDLNNRTFEQLARTKYIGKIKAEAILKQRQDHGPFTDLSQLKNIKGFGKVFFSSLEENGEMPPIVNKFSRQHEILNMIIPNDQQKQTISNIVSIDIGMANAAWVHLDKDHKVLAWKQAHIPKPKPYNPGSFRLQVQAFVESLPQADAFVVEMQSHRVGKQAVALLPFVVHLRIIESMLHCLLQSPVIPMDPLYTAKYFNLPTGNPKKKKAAVDLVESLFLGMKECNFEEECENFLQEKFGFEGSEALVGEVVGDKQLHADTCTTPAEPDVKLQISEELIDYFQSCKKKDDMSDCLLQAMAFYNLLKESQM